MTRTTYVWCPESGAVVPKGTEARAAGVTIIRDFAESVVNPVDGVAYSSRPAYEAATRRAGGIEIGKTEHRAMAERNARGGLERNWTGPSVRQSIDRALHRQD